MPSSRPAMELFGLLRPRLPLLLGCAVLGSVGGIGVAGLLAVVNRGLHAGGGLDGSLLLTFLGLCTIVVVGSIGSDIGANLVGQRLVAELRKTLAARILCAPIESLERYRAHRLVPVLTTDVDTVGDFAFVASTFVVSLAVTLGCLGYLAILSPQMFVVVALAITFGVWVQAIAHVRGIQGFHKARTTEDQLQKHYRAIADGAKELRLNRQRRGHIYHGDLSRTIDRIRDGLIRAIIVFVVARGFGTALFFTVIGIVLALRQLVWPQIDAVTLSGFVLVLLYMRGPVDQVIGSLPAFGRTFVALERIAELSDAFRTPEPGLLAPTAGESRPALPFSSIELRGARYVYPKTGPEEPFRVGPVDVALHAGEIVFVTGENGSGKTTLVKLLLGLYEPAAGELLLNGRAIGPETRDDYRQLFTTVFSDYYLFDDLVGARQQIPAEAERYLERLEVAHKVSLRSGTFSTTDLSTGQRKRLALLNAWIEDRPILVFDEWAADQDPTFRGIFYRDLLPDLRRLGKTILAISHDDRYFDAADRVIAMKDGRIIDGGANAQSPASELMSG